MCPMEAISHSNLNPALDCVFCDQLRLQNDLRSVTLHWDPCCYVSVAGRASFFLDFMSVKGSEKLPHKPYLQVLPSMMTKTTQTQFNGLYPSGEPAAREMGSPAQSEQRLQQTSRDGTAVRELLVHILESYPIPSVDDRYPARSYTKYTTIISWSFV